MLYWFTWDASKARSNFIKHRVSFWEARTVFEDPLARIHDDAAPSDRERREIIVGHSSKGHLLLVSFTERGGATRLISARRATRHEREDYEKSSRP
jgi:uncharacterized DUF497 family protein